MTGYELDKAFKASLAFFWQAKASQIYRELDAMERSGWLTSKRILLFPYTTLFRSQILPMQCV